MGMNLLNWWERVCRSPEGEGGDPAPDPVVDPPQVPVPDPAPDPAQQMVPLSVMQRRIDTITRQKAELERQLELERLNKQLEPDDTKPTPPVVSTIDEATIIAERMVRNDKANKVATAGQALAPDFLPQINILNQTLGGLPDHFIDAVIEAGETEEGAAKLLYELSKDIGKAGSLISMTPTKMAVALAKMNQEKKEVKKPAPKPVPTTPAPIEPKVKGGEVAPEKIDLSKKETPIGDWIRERNAAARERRRY